MADRDERFERLPTLGELIARIRRRESPSGPSSATVIRAERGVGVDFTIGTGDETPRTTARRRNPPQGD